MVAGVLTASGACIIKAGANVSSYFTGAGADANWNVLINMAESVVNVATKTNWIDSYSTLNADTKKILDDITSNIAASYAISYDMSGYTTSGEAATMLNVLRDGTERGLKYLKESANKDFFNAS